MSYIRGTKVVLQAVLTDNETGAPRTSTEVTLTVEDPLGAVTVYTLSGGDILSDPGQSNKYTCLVDTEAAAGTWLYQFEVPGDEGVLERRQFTVKDRLVAV